MSYHIDLRTVPPKRVYPLQPGFSGQTPEGKMLSFSNYYMEIDHKPFFGISGEVHYSRLWEGYWEDEIIKMKAGGINTIATYIFWIHHEEEEGVFDFSGRRDLRRFIQLCAKHGMYVIARLGPFDHGEVRNGGLPDWLFGKPYEVRSLDEGFLRATKRLYHRLAQEMQGLYHKDGGPIIAAQLDNEYMHSAAPWEITSGVANEWMTSGTQGDAYMLKLLDIAREAGIDVPFYTCTGWGGASTPKELMPLWGGYAFRPWIFYSHKGEHPATEEYIYRDNHNNAIPATYNFEPFYPPESKPYLCCEMGGGMTCCYYYRFQIDFESVDAMANIKMASGCNMLGYYMNHGGTNPKGKMGGFMNEGQVPKLSYDYQAALGEFGQVRPSYRRLKAMHLFTNMFEQTLCKMKTVLPEGSQEIDPHDTDMMRYAVRIGEDNAGFLFINNYQDHAATRAKTGEHITLQLPRETIEVDDISLAAGENCILPFNMSIEGIPLRYALAQPLAVIKNDGMTHVFFFAPSGMSPKFALREGAEISGLKGCSLDSRGQIVYADMQQPMPTFTATNNTGSVTFVTLTREESMNFFTLEYAGKQVAVLTEGALLPSADGVRLEHDAPAVSLSVFPADAWIPQGAKADGQYGIFTRYALETVAATIVPQIQQVGPTRYTAAIPTWEASHVKDVLLKLNYSGDIGQAFIDGDMISDNFYNGAPWEIGLREYMPRLAAQPLTIYITPLKEGINVNVESIMAGRKEEADKTTGKLDDIEVISVYEWTL